MINLNLDSYQRLIITLTVTILLMLIEIIGGGCSGSLALLADAGHMFTDTLALLMSLITVRFSQCQPDNRYTFGYLRLTTLTACLNALILFLGTIIISWKAIYRFFDPHPISGEIMMIVTISGFILNVLSFWLLHSSEDKNINIRAATLHIMGDLLGSIGAIVTSLIILYTNWFYIDPCLSIFVSCLMLRSSWLLIRESVHELLEGTPEWMDITLFKNDLMNSIPEIKNIYHIHCWQVGEKPLVTLHVQVIPTCEYHKLLYHIKDHLIKHSVLHSTIQIEFQSSQEEKICTIYSK